MIRLFVVFVAVFMSVVQVARAQSSDQTVWIQIEAQPNLQDGLERARAYARTLADVNGFALGGDWFGIVLGPYTAADAEQVLRLYRSDGRIPRDSFIAQSTAFSGRFFPPDTETLPRDVQPLATVDSPEPLAPVISDSARDITLGGLSQPAQGNTAGPDETPAEARNNERNLTPAERRQIQTALQWAGYYSATIDGAFGRGTRNSMTAWQQAKGFEATGILTTSQRAILLQKYNAVLEGLELRRVTDNATGIEILIPTGRLAFQRYQAPFALFTAGDESKAQALLISQEGNRDTLNSLYEIMQTLAIVPLDGPRSLTPTGFSITGRNAEITSETRVSLSNGQIKGFTLVWPAGEEERRTRLLAEMQASFTRLPGVLDPAAGVEAQQQVDLIAGLQVRKPRISRSGFFVDQNGSVATTAEAVQACTRITLDEEFEADISTLDAGLGIAILTPSAKLSPPQIARFADISPRLASDVAVAGYSYEGILEAPTMTFGTLSDLRGLQGENNLNRLALDSLPGDAGGPVFDDAGNVFGMLLPRGGAERKLPQEVTFALAGEAILATMQRAGLAGARTQRTEAMPPEDITRQARAMTVLVSCWE
ncbi:hypothetical protein ROLI_008550 [Roseobacter fucihabitans]|uniref:Peptidoglycan binding-like domain-containing protein n=1 Tax=Roseobacter fucihabitans TaxID=1537242 RepID=A0ABZ2BSE8_9RHOB|nr:serine protease [Roseobacter litoralis]MBC6966978.1 putative peptidoglycan binding domain protein [Roseobacter litoralis]